MLHDWRLRCDVWRNNDYSYSNVQDSASTRWIILFLKKVIHLFLSLDSPEPTYCKISRFFSAFIYPILAFCCSAPTVCRLFLVHSPSQSLPNIYKKGSLRRPSSRSNIDSSLVSNDVGKDKWKSAITNCAMYWYLFVYSAMSATFCPLCC